MTKPTTSEGPGLFVVVSGGPTDGRHALSRALAPALGLPLMARASAEEALGRSLTPKTNSAQQQLVAAATAVVIAMAADSRGGVLDGVIDLSEAAGGDGLTASLPGTLVEVAYADAPAGPRGWPVVQVDPNSGLDLEGVVDQIVAAVEGLQQVELEAREQWVVWRQDEHGNRAEVTRRESKEMAQKVADAMESTGHKQTYWVEAVG